MANRLTMAKIQAIRGLHEGKWSNRRIARELDVDRETVAKYVRAEACAPKPAKAPLGSEVAGGQATEGGEGPSLGGASGEERVIGASQSLSLSEAAGGDSKPAKAPLGSDPKPAKAPIGSEAVSGNADPVQSPPDSVVSVVEAPHNCIPNSIMKLEGEYLSPYLPLDENFNLRQLKPVYYARNGAAIYAFTYNCLMKKNSIYGEKVLPYVMGKDCSIDVDDLFDLKLCELILSSMKSN